jgi:hypothetical protein
MQLPGEELTPTEAAALLPPPKCFGMFILTENVITRECGCWRRLARLNINEGSQVGAGEEERMEQVMELRRQGRPYSRCLT